MRRKTGLSKGVILEVSKSMNETHRYAHRWKGRYIHTEKKIIT